MWQVSFATRAKSIQMLLPFRSTKWRKILRQSLSFAEKRNQWLISNVCHRQAMITKVWTLSSSHSCWSSVLPLAFSSGKMSNSDSSSWYLSHFPHYTHSIWFILQEPHLPQPVSCLNSHMCVYLSQLTVPEGNGHVVFVFPSLVHCCGILHILGTQRMFVELKCMELNFSGAREREYKQPGESWGITAMRGDSAERRGPSPNSSV